MSDDPAMALQPHESWLAPGMTRWEIQEAGRIAYHEATTREERLTVVKAIREAWDQADA
jgi:hypothetical protein